MRGFLQEFVRDRLCKISMDLFEIRRNPGLAFVSLQAKTDDSVKSEGEFP